MAISSTQGSKLYIGGIRQASTEDIDDFEALTWVEIKKVTNLGEFGDESAQITVDIVGEGRTQKLKGTRNSGTMAVTCAWDPLDPGQNAARLAEKTSYDYAIKVLANDKADANDPNSVFYFFAKVQSARRVQGGPNDVVTMNLSLDLTSEIFEDPSVATP